MVTFLTVFAALCAIVIAIQGFCYFSSQKTGA